MIFFLILLLFCSAFLSGSETSLFSLSPLTLKSYQSSSDKRRNLIAHLMERPRDVLVTVLMLNVLFNILVQNVVSIEASGEDIWSKIGVPLCLTLIFGEVIPKSIAMPQASRISYWVAPVIHGAALFFRPLREPLTRATSFLSRFLFFFLHEERDISIEELRHVLKTSQECGILIEAESELIGGALDLQHLHVKELMRPREDVLLYDYHKPLSQLISLFSDLETSRIPVCDGTLDKLLGILSAKRFFFQKENVNEGSDLLQILKKPYYVPESMKGWTLLRNLRAKGEDLAIVVDEYGSICGLITQEDLIEVVIGDIASRHDSASLYTRSSEDVIIASAKLEIDEFGEIFGIGLQKKENVSTLGGWLIDQLGVIPTVGTKYATDHFLFYVLSAEPNKVKSIYARRLKK